MVLEQLLRAQNLDKFYLVGGTALSLWLGHRKSIDIHLFAHHDFDSQQIAFFLQNKMNAEEIETGKNLIRCYISGIKIEFISHKYPLLKPPVPIDSFRIASIEDLCALKLNAVVNRGLKKDFWDLAYLLDKFELNDILNFYKKKYKKTNLWQVEKSLCYFNDADEELVEIVDFHNQSWNALKDKIRKASKMAF